MNRNSSWMATLVVIGAMAVVAFMAISADVPARSARQAEAAVAPAVEHATCDLAAAPADAAVDPAITVDGAEDLLEPAGICRMAPQCSENADCDYLCGPGAGWCRHSKCPIRVCDCH